jgi:hypothetical protein
MGVKLIYQIQKKQADGRWGIVSQAFCEPGCQRALIHCVSTDENTRVKRAERLHHTAPRYNFCPPGVMTKL